MRSNDMNSELFVYYAQQDFAHKRISARVSRDDIIDDMILLFEILSDRLIVHIYCLEWVEPTTK